MIPLSSIQFSHSVMSNSATPRTAARQASPSITNSGSLLKLISIELVMPSNHLILCRPLLLPPSIFSSIRVFSDESVLCIRWPKYWSFSFNISPSSHNKLKEMGIPDHLTCLMRNLYAGQEATVRTGHGTMDWFQIGKGVCQCCILSPCLFNLYAEYIM